MQALMKVGRLLRAAARAAGPSETRGDTYGFSTMLNAIVIVSSPLLSGMKLIKGALAYAASLCFKWSQF